MLKMKNVRKKKISSDSIIISDKLNKSNYSWYIDKESVILCLHRVHLSILPFWDHCSECSYWTTRTYTSNIKIITVKKKKHEVPFFRVSIPIKRTMRFISLSFHSTSSPRWWNIGNWSLKLSIISPNLAHELKKEIHFSSPLLLNMVDLHDKSMWETSCLLIITLYYFSTIPLALLTDPNDMITFLLIIFNGFYFIFR